MRPERSLFSKGYFLIASAIFISYLVIEERAVVFSATDAKVVPAVWSSTSRSTSSGGFRSTSGRGFSGGFHGGK